MNPYQKMLAMSGPEISARSIMGAPAVQVPAIPAAVQYSEKSYSDADLTAMGIVSSAAIAAGATGVVTVAPQEPFKLARLVINSAFGLNWLIEQMKIASTEYVVGDAILAADLSEALNNVYFDFRTIDATQHLVLSVRNIGPAAATFRATAFGVRLR